MMVRFELTRPPSPGARLVLQPSRILHPRFEDRPSRQGSTGKAMWVTCWADAVTALAQKGALPRFAICPRARPDVPLPLHRRIL